MRMGRCVRAPVIVELIALATMAAGAATAASATGTRALRRYSTYEAQAIIARTQYVAITDDTWSGGVRLIRLSWGNPTASVLTSDFAEYVTSCNGWTGQYWHFLFDEAGTWWNNCPRGGGFSIFQPDRAAHSHYGEFDETMNRIGRKVERSIHDAPRFAKQPVEWVRGSTQRNTVIVTLRLRCPKGSTGTTPTAVREIELQQHFKTIGPVKAQGLKRHYFQDRATITTCVG